MTAKTKQKVGVGVFFFARIDAFWVCILSRLYSVMGSKARLMIKAANGSLADFRVDAQLEWTVHDLKSHLYRHYPSHPVSELAANRCSVVYEHTVNVLRGLIQGYPI